MRRSARTVKDRPATRSRGPAPDTGKDFQDSDPNSLLRALDDRVPLARRAPAPQGSPDQPLKDRRSIANILDLDANDPQPVLELIGVGPQLDGILLGRGEQVRPRCARGSQNRSDHSGRVSRVIAQPADARDFGAQMSQGRPEGLRISDAREGEHTPPPDVVRRGSTVQMRQSDGAVPSLNHRHIPAKLCQPFTQRRQDFGTDLVGSRDNQGVRSPQTLDRFT